MRETSSTNLNYTSTNKAKHAGVLKKVANYVPTSEPNSELSDRCESFSEDEESSFIDIRKESLYSSSVKSLANAETKFQQPDKFLDVSYNSVTKGPTEYYRFIARKLISLDLQMGALKQGQKKILEKLKGNLDHKTRQPESLDDVETIDISCNLPLKDQVTLQELELKLKEDEKYKKKRLRSWQT
ncbi:uncharacterized protein LOC105833627 isoform X2 [Monomorium pharaonis]|nr:uncharacterized protein LOC105833627 isoform X2 [Monomorium pharaonis]